jgi:hypothetical protein
VFVCEPKKNQKYNFMKKNEKNTFFNGLQKKEKNIFKKDKNQNKIVTKTKQNHNKICLL